MERNFKVNPIGLKGNEINERMKELMGIAPINEGISRSTVELTKIGPDGKAYGIVRENHEYYIKVSDKTSNITVEDFKYIGGLQNKKSEAYSSYAKATKHLNLKFNSICESFDIVNTFNVFFDDKLLSEGAAKEAGKHITDTKGTELGSKVKEEGGHNVAEKKIMDEMEEVTLTEDELAIDAMLNEADDEEGDDEMTDKEKEFAALAEPKDKITYADKIAGATKKKTNEGEMDDEKPTLQNYKTNDEFFQALEDADAKKILKSIYKELGKPVVDIAKKVIKKTAGFVGGPEVKDAIAKRDAEKEDMTLEEIQEAIADLKKKL